MTTKQNKKKSKTHPQVLAVLSAQFRIGQVLADFDLVPTERNDVLGQLLGVLQDCLAFLLELRHLLNVDLQIVQVWIGGRRR